MDHHPSDFDQLDYNGNLYPKIWFAVNDQPIFRTRCAICQIPHPRRGRISEVRTLSYGDKKEVVAYKIFGVNCCGEVADMEVIAAQTDLRAPLWASGTEIDLPNYDTLNTTLVRLITIERSDDDPDEYEYVYRFQNCTLPNQQFKLAETSIIKRTRLFKLGLTRDQTDMSEVEDALTGIRARKNNDDEVQDESTDEYWLRCLGKL